MSAQAEEGEPIEPHPAEEQPMAGEAGAYIGPVAEDDAFASSFREDELEEDLRKLVLAVVAVLCVVLLIEFVRHHSHRIGEKFATRHPLLSELFR